jgi:hypothetical protein
MVVEWSKAHAIHGAARKQGVGGSEKNLALPRDDNPGAKAR